MIISAMLSALQGLVFFALHFDNRNSFPRQLTAKEEREYVALAANGDKNAMDMLIKHNLRLVAFIVKKHYPDFRDQDDLISIGTIGLIKAAQTFDYKRSVSFSTYAGKCINNQIRMYFRKIKHQQTEVYLNEPVDCDKDGNTVTLADIFCDSADVAQQADLNINIEKLYRYITDELDDREKEILCKRYGLNFQNYRTEKILTQREVAKQLGISRSYVSRIEKKALEKLRERFERND